VRVDYHRVKDALSATVSISIGMNTYEASGTGDGPVASIGDAILKALQRTALPTSVIGLIRVVEFNVAKSKGGIESIGMVNIKVENDKGVGYGRASDTDVMVASAKAIVSAINHLLQTPV
jgi:2-isopropylmalate synthase